MNKHLLIVTHGNLGAGLLSALEVISAKQPEGIDVISLSAQMSTETLLNAAKSILDNHLDVPNIIFTDIPFGSTTQTVFPLLADYPELYIVTGINLGLLLEVYLSQDDNIPELLRMAIENSRQTLLFLNDRLDDNAA
jgi:mannose/fructose-specific phosphotransferase system component IIA